MNLQITALSVENQELIGLNRSEFLVDLAQEKTVLESQLYPFAVQDIDVQDLRSKQTPTFGVKMKISLPSVGEITVATELDFADFLEPNSSCWWPQHRPTHDRCCKWGVCVDCRFRCQTRICNCNGGGCGPWKDNSDIYPFC